MSRTSHPRANRGRWNLLVGALALSLFVAGCGSTAAPNATGSSAPSNSATGDVTLTVYNAQHENLTTAWATAFTAKTGIKVELRNGDDSEMANQLVAEGGSSPADVFITENSPAMNIVDNADLFAPIDAATKAAVPAAYVPSTESWVGVAARSTVFVYNPTLLGESDLPKSLMDLADPAWKGKWAAAPGGADFQAIISAVLKLKGTDATAVWLKSLKDDAAVYQGNTAVMKAVNSGEVASGVIYHYYWFGDQAGTGENSKNVKVMYFGAQDPGAFVSVSGAGVLASSRQQAAAQQFVAFITSTEGQKIVADTVFEYPISGDANPALKPLTSLDAPVIDPATLNGPDVIQLMTDAGLL